MKIYYPLLCYFPSQAGGPANTVYWLNIALAKLGIQSLVTSTTLGLDIKEIKKLNKLYPPNLKVNFLPNVIGFFSYSEIKKIKKAEIIHFSSLFFAPTLFFLILASFYSKKILISPRGELYSEALKKSLWKKKIYLKIIALFSQKIHFHATNPEEINLIKFHFKNYAGINELSNFILVPEKIDTEIKNQILFLGRINPIKNIDILISSFQRLPQYLQETYKLIIAGDAILENEKSYFENLKTQVKEFELEDRVIFVGGIFGKEKEKLLASSKCLVLPSKSENFGNVVVEALAQGTPVIASINTPWDKLVKYKIGNWVESEPEIIKDSIISIIELNEHSYLACRNRARIFVENGFDIEKNIGKWVELYNKIKVNVQK